MKRVFKDTGRSINNIDILDIEPVDLNWSPKGSSDDSSDESSGMPPRVPNPPVDQGSGEDSSYDPSNMGYSSSQDDSYNPDSSGSDSSGSDSNSPEDMDGTSSSDQTDKSNPVGSGSKDSDTSGQSGESDTDDSGDSGSEDSGGSDSGEHTGQDGSNAEDTSSGNGGSGGSEDTNKGTSPSHSESGGDNSNNSSSKEEYNGTSTNSSSRDNLEDLLKEQESSGKSLMESMLEDIENNKSEVESSMNSKMTRDYSEDNKKSSSNSQDKSSESSIAKGMVGKAVKNSEDADDISYSSKSLKEERDSLLSASGAGSLTSLFNSNIKSDWKSKLDSLFDKASGYDVVMNPNMINKRIEGAPPGREDIASKFNSFVIAVDVSGSMGSGKFKQVISHIDTMLKARNLSSVRFYLVAWGPYPESDVIDSIKVTKGRQVRTTLLSDRTYTRASGGTAIYPLFNALATKVRNPDAIFILTDGDLHTSFHRSEIGESYIKRHHSKIIWCLTHGSTLNRGVSEVDSRVKKERRYIIFHGK